jgi:hypothetical protein
MSPALYTGFAARVIHDPCCWARSKAPQREERQRIAHIARNAEAVGSNRARLSLCGRVVPAQTLVVQPATAECCAQCRKAWLSRWRKAVT